MRNGKVEEITNLSLNGVIEDLKLSANGKRLGIMMTTLITPSDIYVIDIGKDKDYFILLLDLLMYIASIKLS